MTSLTLAQPLAASVLHRSAKKVPILDIAIVGKTRFSGAGGACIDPTVPSDPSVLFPHNLSTTKPYEYYRSQRGKLKLLNHSHGNPTALNM
jgi:hypothetical protein